MSRPVTLPDGPLETSIARLWAEGCDSAEIGWRLVVPEAEVCRVLSRQSDERRRAKLARTDGGSRVESR